MLGNQLGAQIAAQVANGNPLVQIGASTLLGVAFSNLSRVLTAGVTGQLTPTNLNQIFSVTNLTTQTVTSLQGAVGGYISGLLMAELADALNLDGFEGRVFTTVGNVVVSRVVESETRARDAFKMQHICAQNDNAKKVVNYDCERYASKQTNLVRFGTFA